MVGFRMKRKIVIVDGGRMTFGYLRPVIKEIQKRGNLDYDIVVCNCHLLEGFGETVDEIKRDGFKVGAEIYNTLLGLNRLTMIKSLGILMTELPGILRGMKPDIILTAGDRGEQFVAAMVGAHMYIPVAHIQAGERSGNIDGMTRHAIARYAHVHFAANQDAADRLHKTGEQGFRIFNVGSPQLDDFVNGPITSEGEIRKRFKLKKNDPVILLIQHSVTEESYYAYDQMGESLLAVSRFHCPVIIILNNTDAGSSMIRVAIDHYKTPNMQVVEHISRPNFAGLMNTCDVLVGNSSSGIIESPFFNIPVVNIGNRQKDRIHSSNVVHVNHHSNEITSAIREVLSPEFVEKTNNASSVYGDGQSSKRIVDVLEELKINQELLAKRMVY